MPTSGEIVNLRVELRPKFLTVISADGFLLGDIHKDVILAWDNETLGAVVRSMLESQSFDWRLRP